MDNKWNSGQDMDERTCVSYRCWDWTLKSMIWCNKLRFIYKFIYLCFLWFPFIISYALIGHLKIHAYITCIVHDWDALGVAYKYNVQVVHSWFMDLGNPEKTIVHYLLIEGMTCFGRQNGFPMMSALVCIVIHWTEPMMNHNVRLSIIVIRQMTILHGLSTLKGYWVYAKINMRLRLMSETLMWLYILMDWVVVDEGWWQ